MFRLFTPIILSVFGLWIAIYSYIKYADFKTYGAAFYPTIIGFLVFLFAILDFLMELKIKNKNLNFNLSIDGKFILLIAAVVIFYIVAANYLGFILTTAIILNAMVLPLVKKNKIFIGAFLIILSIGIYLLFAKVLLVGLPSGILFK